MIIKMESIKRMFEQNDASENFTCEGQCHSCHCDVKIEIEKTSGGYGLNGGVIYEQDSDDFVFICENCHKLNILD